MKCENNLCTTGSNAYTIFDMTCNKCGTRWCNKCSQKYKCNYCRLRYCPCFGVICPYKQVHESISWIIRPDYYDDEDEYICLWDNIIHNDKDFINRFCFYGIPFHKFECTSEKVVLNGKLTLDLAKLVVDKLTYYIIDGQKPVENWGLYSNIGNESIHIETDYLWKWYLKSMKFYTIDEAREIADVLLTINRADFWYA